MPEVFNKTPLTTEVVPLVGADGRQVFVVIGKATLDIDRDGHLRLADAQVPIEYVDRMASGLTQAPMQFPSDLLDRKPSVTDGGAPGSDAELHSLRGRLST